MLNLHLILNLCARVLLELEHTKREVESLKTQVNTRKATLDQVGFASIALLTRVKLSELSSNGLIGVVKLEKTRKNMQRTIEALRNIIELRELEGKLDALFQSSDFAQALFMFHYFSLSTDRCASSRNA